MNRALKIFLLWLLIASLPVQGSAAVVKASCGPTHHHSLPLWMHSEAGHHHLDDDLEIHPPEEHRHSDGSVHSSTFADQADPDSVHSESSDTQQSHKSSYCSACATCCFGTVAPPVVSTWTPEYGSPTAVATVHVSRFTGYIPAGLERPPKHRSA